LCDSEKAAIPPDEANVASRRSLEGAKAKLYGESVDEDQRARDRGIMDRRQRAEGVDLSVEADRARERLEAVG
jgi:hypothetical protein